MTRVLADPVADGRVHAPGLGTRDLVGEERACNSRYCA